MSAYVVVDLTVKDADALNTYSLTVQPLLAACKGRVLAKGAPHVLHGKASYERKVIFEFPTEQDALDWYNSPQYQKVISIRDKGIDSQFHLIS